MPANKYALLRYRIIDRCLTTRQAYPTKEELRQACEEALYGSDGEHISISTVEKDLWAMRNEADLGFYAPIEYHRDERGYYYSEEGYSINDVQLNDDDLDAIRFATNTLIQFRELPIFQQFDQALGKIADRLAVSPNLDTQTDADFIQFESTPHASGSEHLGPLLQAIRGRHPIQLGYRKFSDEGDVVSRYALHPYLLKEYRNRWYLLAWDDQKGGIKTFGCDRIFAVDIEEQGRFKLNEGFQAQDYFTHAVGITVLGKGKAELIQLNATFGQIFGLPTSSSLSKHQWMGEKQIVSLNVFTFELLQWLQAHAGELTLLHPTHIRESVERQLEAACQGREQLNSTFDNCNLAECSLSLA